MLQRTENKLNKGFSLLEVIVAVAIGSIVLLIIAAFVANGTGFFKRQMNSVRLQNELQEVSNKITDALMEATSIYVYDDGTATYIFTGDFSDTIVESSDVETLASGETWASYENKSEQRMIMWVHTGSYAGYIYIFDREFFVNDSTGEASDIADITFAGLLGEGTSETVIKNLEGYCITKNAILYDSSDRYDAAGNSLTIDINEDCLVDEVVLDEDGNAVLDEDGHTTYTKASYEDVKGNLVYAYEAPALFTVNLTLESNGEQKNDTKVTAVRNNLSSLFLYDTYYGTSY